MDKEANYLNAGQATLDRTVRARLADWLWGHPNRDDRSPVELLVRGWRQLDAEGGLRVARACGKLLRDPDVKVRGGAVMFFQGASKADDEGALLAALQDASELYDGVKDPWNDDSEQDLRAELARALAMRLRMHPEYLEAVRGEALRPGRGGVVLAGLSKVDPEWVVEQLGDILETVPHAFEVVLFNLDWAGHDRDALVAVQKVRGLIADEEIERLIRSELQKAELRDQALALLRDEVIGQST